MDLTDLTKTIINLVGKLVGLNYLLIWPIISTDLLIFHEPVYIFSRVLSRELPTFDLDPWPWPQPVTLTLKQVNSDVKTSILAFDLDLCPTTLTYNTKLAKVKVNLHTKYQGRRVKDSAMRGQTEGWKNGQTNGRRVPSTLSPSLQGRYKS